MAKLDHSVSSVIYAWLLKNLNGTSNPRVHGKGLPGDLSGFWRYRVGKYRLIAEIRDSEIIIEIVNVGHRANVYDA
ncbi:plasmid stabilization system protein [Clostridia bacterium]|nr:plasmid stabilization system protein [Clostridia bacterium]